MQPKWTMPGRVKYIPNKLWTQTPYPTDSHLDKSNNYSCKYNFRNRSANVALLTLLNLNAPFQISDHIILCSHDIRRKNTWNNVVLIVQQFVSRFPICLTKNLIEHINFSSDRPVHRSQQNHRGAQISLRFLEGTDKLRLICLFYYLLNCTQRHVL